MQKRSLMDEVLSLALISFVIGASSVKNIHINELLYEFYNIDKSFVMRNVYENRQFHEK